MMAFKKLQFIKKILKLILLLITIAAALALVLAFLAKITKPSFSHITAFCGLFFLYILIANIFFAIVWLFIDYRWSLVPVIAILINVNNIDRHFQLRAQDKPETCANCIKVMSYNARVFGVYQANDDTLKRKQYKKEIMQFFQRECPDILCIQEYFFDKSGKLHFNTTQEILHAMDLPNNDRNYRLYICSTINGPHQFGLAVFSRYRIVNSGLVEMPDSSANKAMFVDVRYNGDTLRIYNIHLQSMSLGKEDYATSQAVLHNDISDPDFDEKAARLYNKITGAYERRQLQAQTIRAHIDTCEHPVIICGDFNDSPASYSVHKIAHGFKDSFRSSGKGVGATHFGDGLPPYRIDYIFHSNHYNDFGHQVCSELTVSDHRPIYTYISIIDKKQ